ncbi:MAG: hypothetical protein IJP41_04350 [Synergistaceae bacterium]|nr:hypothetical protein [Synergistaceae bacterium]
MRLFISTLSLLSVISFGYALAGYGRTFFGSGIRFDYVVGGLAGGFICGGIAMILWYVKRKDFFEESNENEI